MNKEEKYGNNENGTAGMERRRDREEREGKEER